MTNAQKLSTLKVLLEDGSGYMPTDEVLNTYITLSANEILAWMYHLNGGVPEEVTEIPATGTLSTRICLITFTTMFSRLYGWGR